MLFVGAASASSGQFQEHTAEALPATGYSRTITVGVFNVFNSQEVTSMNEVTEDGTSGDRLETAFMPLSFQQPRSVRFMVQYDF